MTQHRHGLFRDGDRWCNRQELERLRREAEGDDIEAERRMLRAELRCGDFKSKIGRTLGRAMAESTGPITVQFFNMPNPAPRSKAQTRLLKKTLPPAINKIARGGFWEIYPITAPLAGTFGYRVTPDRYEIEVRGPEKTHKQDLQNLAEYLRIFTDLLDDWSIELKVRMRVPRLYLFHWGM